MHTRLKPARIKHSSPEREREKMHWNAKGKLQFAQRKKSVNGCSPVMCQLASYSEWAKLNAVDRLNYFVEFNGVESMRLFLRWSFFVPITKVKKKVIWSNVCWKSDVAMVMAAVVLVVYVLHVVVIIHYPVNHFRRNSLCFNNWNLQLKHIVNACKCRLFCKHEQQRRRQQQLTNDEWLTSLPLIACSNRSHSIFTYASQRVAHRIIIIYASHATGVSFQLQCLI